MESLINVLKKLKFTEYESKVYIALLENGSCTGYKLSKVSGVPRSKIYRILETLVSQGVVEQSTAENSSLYQAISPEQLSALLESSFKETLSTFKEESALISMEKSNHTIWELEEWRSILSKIKMHVSEAKSSLLIQVWVDELDDELTALINQKQQELDDVVIVLYDRHKEYQTTLTNYYAHGFEQDKLSEIGHRWITIVSDKADVLYATVPFKGKPKAIHTKNPILSFFASEYVIHDAYCLRLIDNFPEQIKNQYGEDMKGLRNLFSI
ncbi:MAG: helix-turn-helix domain-containing protein [Alkalibacterium sp.]|uniref:TrmB family transcriptional regulator n=1 Tax=Alkalibacterium sp. TaxID=1872447 RepID=UPI0026486254|nr:TrmB family transcriptional regulator [Alkalibacterium sp.]MDN6295590.1 helix-turn-helix domain-containing protein [Alkalibacterium sp.]